MGAAMTGFVVVLCTAPPGEAEKIAETLVRERLAACVNVSPVKSYFIWDEKPSVEAEELMIIKTEERLVESLQARIVQLHSYQIPEIIVLPIIGGSEPYLRWIAASVG